MIEIDFEKAEELLSRAVELKGYNYVYPNYQCVYVNSPDEEAFPWNTSGPDIIVEEFEPSCIVGVAMHIAGVPLERMTGTTVGDSEELFIEIGDIVTVTGPARELFKRVQLEQDDRQSWGRALMTALERMNIEQYP